MASFGMSLLAVRFGGIHFIAWYSEFSSRAELILWLAACIILTAVPLAPWIGRLVSVRTGCLVHHLKPAILLSMLLLPLLYLAGRAATLVIAFTALRSLPNAGLSDVDWTTFNPHI
jgi:hypothetical protein